MDFQPFNLICPFCLYQFLDKDLSEKERVSKILSDGSGHIIFNCVKCGQELESIFILKPPKTTENFNPKEVKK